MSEKFYVALGGGLGDTLQTYLSDPVTDRAKELRWDDPAYYPTTWPLMSCWLRRLEDFKVKHPNVETRMILECTARQSARELFEYHPAIDSIKSDYWRVIPPGQGLWDKWKLEHDGYAPLHYNFDYQDYQPCEPKVYMTAEEADLVDKVALTGPYIAIHPFAGHQCRIAYPVEKYLFVIEALRRKGFNSVLLGGTYTKFGANNRKMLEVFPYEADGLFNCVGKISARAAVNLVFEASGFVGTHSSMLLAAWFKRMKSVCIVPEYREGGEETFKHWFTQVKHPLVWGIGQPFSRTIYVTEDSPTCASEIVEIF